MGGLLIGTGTDQPESYAMGKWLERYLTGDADGEFWKNVEKARPLVRQRADRILTELGYDPAKLTAKVYVKGEGGDEAWTVAYWQGAAERYRGDVEVYLNNQGKVRRVVRFNGEHEQLLYGKDERIEVGMTPDEVRARPGEPNYKGPPPRPLRAKFDEMWQYQATPDRTVTIHVYFKGGRVISDSIFGE